MLDGLAPARRRLVLLLVAGLLLGVVAAAVVVVVRSRGGGDPVAQDEPGPVLLVSGYGGSTRALEPLRDALEETGRDVVVVPVVGEGTGDLDAQAAALAGPVRDAMSAADAPSVDLVGYSAGGVVARLFVRSHGGDAVVRRVLTLGSPQHGTDVAALAVGVAGRCPQACEQLEPDSDLLRRLNARDETPAGPRFVSVWSTSDRTVVPTDSARLDGAVNLTVQSVCPDARTTHGQLPADPVVRALLTSALGAGPPRTPTGCPDAG